MCLSRLNTIRFGSKTSKPKIFNYHNSNNPKSFNAFGLNQKLSIK